MSDHFAALGFPPRPALDPAALKQAYLTRAAQLHPDSAQGDDQRFTALQEAHRILSQPALRLRHLIELTHPSATPGSGLPKNSALLFDLGTALQKAKDAAAQREKAQTALGRAVAATQITQARQALTTAAAPLATAEEVILADLATLDTRWPEVSLDELSTLARELAFLARWKNEVSEWEFKLANG